MNIEFTVRLPVDEHSVPFARGLCRQALEHLSIDGSVINEISLALTEACANVVQHSGQHGTGDYEVSVDIDDLRCRISVVDNGEGFDPATARAQEDGPDLEGGRGMLLMQALVDTLRFQRDADGHHRVTLEKRLTTEPLATA